MTSEKCLFGDIRTAVLLVSNDESRTNLLAKTGLQFSTMPSDIYSASQPEMQSDLERSESDVVPQELVQARALRNATAVAERYQDALVVAMETVVYLNGRILHAPEKPSVGLSMLREIRNNTHSVFTGVAFVHRVSDRQVTCVEETKVSVSNMTSQEMTAYVASGCALQHRAGFNIDDRFGCFLVDGIVGDHNNIRGVPLRRFYRTLVRDFADLLIFEFPSESPRASRSPPANGNPRSKAHRRKDKR